VQYLNAETSATADNRPAQQNKVNWTDKTYWNFRYNM